MAVEMEAIIRKVEKLLALGTSSNEHEAASAVAKAQDLMEAYGLAMEQVTGRKAARDDVREGTGFDVYEYGKPTAWRESVLDTVAKTSGVWIAKGYRNERVESKHAKYGSRYASMRTAYLIGLPADVQTAGYAYSFLVGEIERLAQAEASRVTAKIVAMSREQGISIHDAERNYVAWGYGSHPLRIKASFTQGAAAGVVEMLQAEARARRSEANIEANALVVNREQIIRDYWYQKQYGKTYAEYMADLKARADAYSAANPRAVAKPLSPSEARRQAEAADRRYDRQQRTQENAEQRKWANIDHTAYRAGREAGRSMSVRPGVERGSAAGASRQIEQGN